MNPSKCEDEPTTTRYTERVPPPNPSKLAAWARYVVHVRAARTFIEACESEGIPVLPVKGIVTAHTLYGDPTERPMRDVDVRVPWRDFSRLRALGRGMHWPIVDSSKAYRNLVFKIDGVDVDVESTVGVPNFCSLDIAEMLARSQPSNILGFQSRVPDFVDHVVLLTVNVFKDKFSMAQRSAIDDLERVSGQPAFRPSVIAQALRAYGVMTVGWLTADFLARSPNCGAWRCVRDELGPIRRPLYARVLKRTESRPNTLISRLATRAGSDGVLDRLRTLTTTARWQVEEWRGRHRVPEL